MFVLSAALMRSGLVAALSAKLTDLSKAVHCAFWCSHCSRMFHVGFHQQHAGGGGVYPGGLNGLHSARSESLKVPDADLVSPPCSGGSCDAESGRPRTSSCRRCPRRPGYGEIGMFEFSGARPGGRDRRDVAYLILFSHRLLPTPHDHRLDPDRRRTSRSTSPRCRIGSGVPPRSGRSSPRRRSPRPGCSVAELIRGDRIQRMDARQWSWRKAMSCLIRGDLNKILELDRESMMISIATEGRAASKIGGRRGQAGRDDSFSS